MVVRAIDERDVGVGAAELPRDRQSAEAAADDDNAPVVPRLPQGPPDLSGWTAGAPIRSSRWSPTRSALAIAVSAGLTAPMLGKKLVSTT